MSSPPKLTQPQSRQQVQKESEEIESVAKSEEHLDLEEFEGDKVRVVKKLHEVLAFLKSSAPVKSRKSVLDAVKGPLLAATVPSSLPRKNARKEVCVARKRKKVIKR
jgi:hypothetical protein